MTFRHYSRSPQVRSPFGAVPCNTTVRLSCQVDSCQAQETTCTLRIWIDGEGETLTTMNRGEDGMFSTTLTRDTPAIVWYSFIIFQADGTEVRIGAPAGAQGGEGVVYDYAEVPSFQLTVYQPRRQRPAWYENGQMDRYVPQDSAGLLNQKSIRFSCVGQTGYSIHEYTNYADWFLFHFYDVLPVFPLQFEFLFF